MWKSGYQDIFHTSQPLHHRGKNKFRCGRMKSLLIRKISNDNDADNWGTLGRSYYSVWMVLQFCQTGDYLSLETFENLQTSAEPKCTFPDLVTLFTKCEGVGTFWQSTGVIQIIPASTSDSLCCCCSVCFFIFPNRKSQKGRDHYFLLLDVTPKQQFLIFFHLMARWQCTKIFKAHSGFLTRRFMLLVEILHSLMTLMTLPKIHGTHADYSYHTNVPQHSDWK